MAKKRFFNIDNESINKAKLIRIEKYAQEVTKLYELAAIEFGKIGASILNHNPDKIFSFKDYPQTNERVNQLLKDTFSKITRTIKAASSYEWDAANIDNDNLVNAIFKTSKLSKEDLSKYTSRNLEALKAFQNRKDDGRSLSDRIWNYTKQFKSEVELTLDQGLGEGKSASYLSQLIKQNLKEPEKLFRRVRNKRGDLVLSKNAEQYNPGQGVYRSSYKNAMRLTRTEINRAYRESDYERWQQLDFVVGIEIRLSNNPNHCPTCIALKGIYPKEFKFFGWHPQCRCNAITILKTDKEIDADDDRILQGKNPLRNSVNAVKDVPSNFKTWLNDNKDRIDRAKSTPYWIRDNFKDGKVDKGLNFKTKVVVKPKDKKFTLDDDNIKNLQNKGWSFGSEKTIDRNVSFFNDTIKGFDLNSIDNTLTEISKKNDVNWITKSIFQTGDNLAMVVKGENNAGRFILERSFKKLDGDLIVYHDYFAIPESVQGKGISKQIFNSLYNQYKNAGVTNIDVHANIDVGGYTWAKYGFNARSRGSIYKLIYKAKNTLSGSDLLDFEKWLSKSEKNNLFKMKDIASKSYGKKLLLGSDWYGFINLSDPKQRRVFEDYLK